MDQRTPISSETIAGLVVDALVDAGLIPRGQFAEAVAIAAREIRVRLQLGNTIDEGAVATRHHLRQLIDHYLSDRLDLPNFWKRFTFAFADTSEGGLSEVDKEWFGVVNDHLHHADWTDPAAIGLISPGVFREWLRGAATGWQAPLPFPPRSDPRPSAARATEAAI